MHVTLKSKLISVLNLPTLTSTLFNHRKHCIPAKFPAWCIACVRIHTYVFSSFSISGVYHVSPLQFVGRLKDTGVTLVSVYRDLSNFFLSRKCFLISLIFFSHQYKTFIMYLLCRNNMPNCGDLLLPLCSISLCKAQELLNYILDRHRDCGEHCRQSPSVLNSEHWKRLVHRDAGAPGCLVQQNVIATLSCCWLTGRGRGLICCVWIQPLNTGCNQARSVWDYWAEYLSARVQTAARDPEQAKTTFHLL